MGRFKSGLRCKEWVNSVIINIITEVITCRISFIKVQCKNMYVHNKCIVLNY